MSRRIIKKDGSQTIQLENFEENISGSNFDFVELNNGNVLVYTQNSTTFSYFVYETQHGRLVEKKSFKHRVVDIFQSEDAKIRFFVESDRGFVNVIIYNAENDSFDFHEGPFAYQSTRELQSHRFVTYSRDGYLRLFDQGWNQRKEFYVYPETEEMKRCLTRNKDIRFLFFGEFESQSDVVYYAYHASNRTYFCSWNTQTDQRIEHDCIWFDTESVRPLNEGNVWMLVSIPYRVENSHKYRRKVIFYDTRSKKIGSPNEFCLSSSESPDDLKSVELYSKNGGFLGYYTLRKKGGGEKKIYIYNPHTNLFSSSSNDSIDCVVRTGKTDHALGIDRTGNMTYFFVRR